MTASEPPCGYCTPGNQVWRSNGLALSQLCPYDNRVSDFFDDAFVPSHATPGEMAARLSSALTEQVTALRAYEQYRQVRVSVYGSRKGILSEGKPVSDLMLDRAFEDAYGIEALEDGKRIWQRLTVLEVQIRGLSVLLSVTGR